jgi:hypothetical protein
MGTVVEPAATVVVGSGIELVGFVAKVELVVEGIGSTVGRLPLEHAVANAAAARTRAAKPSRRRLSRAPR